MQHVNLKEKRKICFIPIYGTIVFLLIIVNELKKIDELSRRQQAAYMSLAGLLGAVGIFAGGLLLGALFRIFGLDLDRLFDVLFVIIAVLFAWPLMTFPVIEYSKKAQKIIDDHYSNTPNTPLPPT